jgi:hypothetical protein
MLLKFASPDHSKKSLDPHTILVVEDASEKAPKASLTQLFEECEYHWPAIGSVLSVDSAVGGWLMGKLGTAGQGGMLEVVPETAADKPRAAPRRITAQVPGKPPPKLAAGLERDPVTKQIRRAETPAGDPSASASASADPAAKQE